MSGHTFSRGEIYYTDFGDGVGSEQKGYRPAVIISNDIGNKHSTTVIIAAIITQRPDKAKLPTHVYVGTETGLDNSSIILLEQIRTISKGRLDDYVGKLSQGQLQLSYSEEPFKESLESCYNGFLLRSTVTTAEA